MSCTCSPPQRTGARCHPVWPMHSTCRRCTYNWESLTSTSFSPCYHVSPVASLCRNWMCGVVHQVCSQGVQQTLVYTYVHSNLTHKQTPHAWTCHTYHMPTKRVCACSFNQLTPITHATYCLLVCMHNTWKQDTQSSLITILMPAVYHTHMHTHTHMMWCDASGVFSGCATHTTCILNNLSLTHTHHMVGHATPVTCPQDRYIRTCWSSWLQSHMFLPSCMHAQGIQSISGCLSHVRKVIHCIWWHCCIACIKVIHRTGDCGIFAIGKTFGWITSTN